MNSHVIYYSEQVPLNGGAYVHSNYTALYKMLNFFSTVLNIALIGLFIYLIYLLLSLAYSKYKEVLDTVIDTNEKVTKINNYLESMMVKNQKQEIANIQIEAPKEGEEEKIQIEEPKNEEEKVYIVDEEGTVIDSKKTEE